MSALKPTEAMKTAYSIAKNGLKVCYGDYGIMAGRLHFDDYWARDAFFATFGALELGDKAVVKRNLELFLKFTSESGQVPLRIGTYDITQKFINPIFFPHKQVHYNEIKPRYLNDRNKNFPVDVNSLFLVSTYYYIKKTKDLKFAKEVFPKLQKILARNFHRNKKYSLLLNNLPASSWDDSLSIKSESIYTNVCHCAAVRSMSLISKLINHPSHKNYNYIFVKIKTRINKLFWNGEFYSNFLITAPAASKKKNFNIFSTAGNLLAIHWHIADRKKALSIEKKIEEYGINKYVPSLTNYPKYPNNFVYLPFYFLGTYDYHNMGMCWLWLGCEDVIVKQRLGLHEDAYKLIGKISDIIARYNNVYEVYEQNGRPVTRLFYKSEAPFAWSSALFVTAYHALFKYKKSVVKWGLDSHKKSSKKKK